MLRYLTIDIPGTGGIIKEIPEDFLVEEVPLYLPCGEGEHTYVTIEKRGLTTLEAVRRISRALGVPDREIGYAGMKDAVGVTRQTVSIPRVSPDVCSALNLPGIAVLASVRHRNKLRLGHLAGNRFRVRVREVGDEASERAEAVLAVLTARGVPNYFGAQRYGLHGNSHLIGRAMVRGEWRTAFDHVIGDPVAVRDERWRGAIEAYRRGDLEESIRLFPGHCRTERDILQRLLKRPDAHEKAFYAIHPRLKKLYLSAYQSSLFDRLLAERLDAFDRVMAGDLAMKHENGACFLVTDAAAEQPRAAAFEISPTGPMFGFRMLFPEGEPRAMEEALLAAEELELSSFNLPGGLAMDGERRPLRVPLREPSAMMDNDALILSFALPRGSYATSVLREVVKP
ncbi:MAG TPA: tRNA pseudouridine(13) synthase TruD [Geobacteraceae bacterium]|nr:tRNA pseudouridine(13) synthase TruD [Geobacteraceae bacterium]